MRDYTRPLRRCRDFTEAPVARPSYSSWMPRTFIPCTLAVCWLLAASHPSGQQQQPPSQPRPERGADLHAIQFAAVAEDGTPITDLRAEEVKVRIGGRERAVRSLQLITLNEAVADATVPPPFGSNAVASAGRNLVLVVDEDSFRPTQLGPLRASIESLLAKLGPDDRVLLATVPLGGIRVPFTNDHTKIRASLTKIGGHTPATETGSEFACRTRKMLEALVAFIESIGVRENQGALVLLTSSIAAPRRDNVAALAPGMCELSENLFNRVSVAAGAGRLQLYAVRPGDASDRGAASLSAIGSDNPIAGIEHLVGVTKGKMLALTGSGGTTAFDRIARETAAYYTASVESQPGDFNGRAQILDVRVTRRDVELRTSPSITFDSEPGTAKLSMPSIRDMMGTPRVFRSLPLRAAGFPALAAEGENIRVIVLAEPVEPGVKLEVAAGALFDQDGKLVAQWLASPEEMKRPMVMGAMAAPAGAYRLRVAAIDTTGRAGTADYDVTAEVVRSGPLKLSSLVLGLSRGGTFVPKLQFVDEPLAVAYVELQGAASGTRLNAALEIAETLNGPAIATVPLTISGTGENRYEAMGSVPIGALPAGDYVARAVIGVEGHPMTRVTRVFRKAIKAAAK